MKLTVFLVQFPCILYLWVQLRKVIFEIPLRMSHPYIGRYDLYATLTFQELLHFRAHLHFLNAPLQNST